MPVGLTRIDVGTCSGPAHPLGGNPGIWGAGQEEPIHPEHPGDEAEDGVDQYLLADAAENLFPARMQMAVSLGWHIIFSCLGVAFPAIVLFVEWRAH